MSNFGPYSKEVVLEYMKFYRKEIDDKMAEMIQEAESGFARISFNMKEPLFYNIQHQPASYVNDYEFIPISVSNGWRCCEVTNK